MARRKSDEAKLEEGRGTGRMNNYVPWIFVHEFGSKGRVHRIYGWKTNRVHHLLSDLELYYFLNIQFDSNVIDIREQFPLKLEDTILIANKLGIKHPAINNKIGFEVVMTTDFVITVETGKNIKDIVRTIKFEDDLSKRTIDKFRIEKEYFKSKGINDWGLITNNSINLVKARNLYALYDSFFWDKQSKLIQNDISEITYDFLKMLNLNNYRVMETVANFTDYMCWNEGEGLVFLKYLITHKKIETDMNIPLNFKNIKVWIKEK